MVCVFHQLLPPRWTGDSTCPWRATGSQASEAGRKGGQRRTGRRDPVEQVTMDNASEGVPKGRRLGLLVNPAGT
jgi:hypothetical protein